MRVSRFGLLVLMLVFSYVVFVGTQLSRMPLPPTATPHGPAASVDEVKSDLCRLAAAEREFHRLTGGYASESELRANDSDAFPTLAPWPYHYLIAVPAPDAFTIVATHYGPLNDAPAAVVTDASGQICVVTPELTQRLDAPSRKQDSPGRRYECEVCVAVSSETP